MTGNGADTPEMRVATDAAKKAAAIVMRHFRDGVEFRHKHAAGLVSDADTESETAIVGVIREAFPGHAILAEESHRGDAGAEHLWVVDPLDGTNNFAHRLPHFAISIAYYRDGRPECGIVHNPARDEWYTAVRGHGAFHDGVALGVSESERLDEVFVGVGFYYDRGAMMEATLRAIHDLFGADIDGIRRLGAASLDLCSVAAGQFAAYFEYELSPWDFAAGRLVVEEAGGRVTTCGGDPLPLASSTLLASNGRLHPAMLDIVKPHMPAR